MAYQITALKGSGKEIIQKVMAAEESQLLIPPRLATQDFELTAPPKDDEKYIGLFSSGTTGIPKCIWNKYSNLKLNAKLSAKAFEVGSHHFLLMMAAPWHVAGFTWVLMAEHLDCEYLFITTMKGDHDLWIKTIQDAHPDYLFTVPAVLRTLYDENWFVENIAYGGYSIKYNEYEKLSPHCSTMYQGYGQTEAGGLISVHKRRSTVIPDVDENLCHGFPIEGTQIRCNGTVDSPSPIFLYSPTAVFRTEYNTNDLGFRDKEGRIYLTDRSEILQSLSAHELKTRVTKLS